MFRKAVVGGYFYPESPSELKKIFSRWSSVEVRDNPKMLIVPHAGYIYSGEVAWITFSSSNIPEKILLLGPNHTGFGSRVSVYPAGFWETPFGDISVDEGLVNNLLKNGLNTDMLAHMKEHSLEVLIPMIKYLNNSTSIVPIAFMNLSYEDCEKVAEKIYNGIMDHLDGILLVVSSDFNHFENEEVTNRKDQLAISRILDLDPSGLYEDVLRYDISMCGVVPCTVGLLIAQKIGCKKGVLLKHTTSGKMSGDYDRVVGYAGIKIY
ncbi:MAG: AmmeMemoRadiSam system protein B [Calditerrivibrio sp.]|nr:AmmeMemoRadiSam system protein B [Calditerrivibrio sp.]MCA1932196.1 AmmeMemoRadiSam system protein B [Calditerrivibrio sp.]